MRATGRAGAPAGPSPVQQYDRVGEGAHAPATVGGAFRAMQAAALTIS